MKSVCASDRVSSACFFLLLSLRRGRGAALPWLYLRYHFRKNAVITELCSKVYLYVLYSKYPFSPCFSAFPAGYKKWLSVNIKKFYLISPGPRLNITLFFINFINSILYFFPPDVLLTSPRLQGLYSAQHRGRIQQEAVWLLRFFGILFINSR